MSHMALSLARRQTVGGGREGRGMGVWTEMYLAILEEENPRELRRLRRLPEAARRETLAAIDRALILYDGRLRREHGLDGDGVERVARRELVVGRMKQLAGVLDDGIAVAAFQFVALQEPAARETVRIDVGATPADGVEVRFEADLRRGPEARQRSRQGEERKQ